MQSASEADYVRALQQSQASLWLAASCAHQYAGERAQLPRALGQLLAGKYGDPLRVAGQVGDACVAAHEQILLQRQLAPAPLTSACRVALQLPTAATKWRTNGGAAAAAEPAAGPGAHGQGDVGVAQEPYVAAFLRAHRAAYGRDVPTLTAMAAQLHDQVALGLFDDAYVTGAQLYVAKAYLAADARRSLRPLYAQLWPELFAAAWASSLAPPVHVAFWASKHLRRCAAPGGLGGGGGDGDGDGDGDDNGKAAAGRGPDAAALGAVSALLHQLLDLPRAARRVDGGPQPPRTSPVGVALTLWEDLAQLLARLGCPDGLMPVFGNAAARDGWLADVRAVYDRLVQAAPHYAGRTRRAPPRAVAGLPPAPSAVGLQVLQPHRGYTVADYAPPPPLFARVRDQLWAAAAGTVDRDFDHLLVHSQPGAGKSEALRAILAELCAASRAPGTTWPRPIYVSWANLTQFFDKHYGESARKTQAFFAALTREADACAGVVALVLEDVEALLGAQGAGDISEDKRVVGAFLQNLDRSQLPNNVVVFASANDVALLHAASASRFAELAYEAPVSLYGKLATKLWTGLGYPDGPPRYDYPDRSLPLQDVTQLCLAALTPRKAHALVNEVVQAGRDQGWDDEAGMFALLDRLAAQLVPQRQGDQRAGAAFVYAAGDVDGALQLLAHGTPTPTSTQPGQAAAANDQPAHLLHVAADARQGWALLSYAAVDLQPHHLLLHNRLLPLPRLSTEVVHVAAAPGAAARESFVARWRWGAALQLQGCLLLNARPKDDDFDLTPPRGRALRYRTHVDFGDAAPALRWWQRLWR